MSRFETVALKNSAATSEQTTGEANLTLDELEIARQTVIDATRSFNTLREKYLDQHGAAVRSIGDTRDVAGELHNLHAEEALPDAIPEPTITPTPAGARARRR
jgi:hypothetical protein